MSSDEQMQWRPQAFGRRNVKDIADPVIEPMWRGDRVLVTVAAGGIGVQDPDGAAVTEDIDEIVEQLRTAVLSDDAVIDGYLTRQATSDPAKVYKVAADVPTAGQMTSQMLVGRGIGSRALPGAMPEEAKAELGNPLAFVAVDLLSVDGQALLDIPLLERKRLLDSLVRESNLVRRCVYVRLPVDTWLSSWRALGFRELAYKSANGRYLPGEINDSWAVVRIPTT